MTTIPVVFSVPELVVQLFCLLSVRSLHIAIVMEGSAGKVVHVDPNGSSPVRGVMLSVVLREGGREEGEREREKIELRRYLPLPLKKKPLLYYRKCLSWTEISAHSLSTAAKGLQKTPKGLTLIVTCPLMSCDLRSCLQVCRGWTPTAPTMGTPVSAERGTGSRNQNCSQIC